MIFHFFKHNSIGLSLETLFSVQTWVLKARILLSNIINTYAT